MGTREVQAEIIRKIQTKNIVGNVRNFVPKLEGEAQVSEIVPLFQVYGHANGTRRGESEGRPWVGLVGRFEAVNITQTKDEKTGELVTDGRVFAAPQCFLPEPMASMLAEQLDQLIQDTDDQDKPIFVDGKPKMVRAVDSLEFAFQIGVKATKTPIGYEYTTSPIVKPGGADPLADLRTRIPALQAPEPAKPEAAPEPVKTEAAKPETVADTKAAGGKRR
jgi:hypothetical protein